MGKKTTPATMRIIFRKSVTFFPLSDLKTNNKNAQTVEDENKNAGHLQIRRISS